ncbi:hypothetical protein [Rickettsia endosymbiont of Ixodes pacificus]|uniref:hypothetical protein n=1 Tax=Rickettsia endosymbiont of Ixodes pacificus TaxID=1133329 RepID=UPI0012E0BC90|nr:hypothetical protein [Rickettsia endosymbiont of Ixodes pacificus]
MLTNTELYSNKNIKLVLLHHMQDKVIDLDIFDYDVNKEKEEQWNKQQKKLIKKLKFDLYKFESSQLTEKFYVLGQKDNNAVITAASIIRFLKQDDELIIDVIPVILHKYSRSIYNDLNMQSVLDDIAIDILCTRRSGTLIKSEGIDIGKFIEVIKLRINNIDNPINIDEDIKKVIEVPSSNYKIAHQEIVDKYKIEFQDNEGKSNYSSEEDEILDIIDQIKDTIEHEEIICEVVEQLITRTVKKSEKGEKNLSWDISVIDNEGRTRNNKEVKLNDREAIEIFAKAVEKWDLELFKEAKDKSKDFAKLVDYFDEEIKNKFWVHFYNNIYYQGRLTEELNIDKLLSTKIEYNNYIQKISDGYAFLISNIPSIWDKLKQEQLYGINQLSKSDKISKDLIAIIEGKINPVQAQQNNNINDDAASNNIQNINIYNKADNNCINNEDQADLLVGNFVVPTVHFHHQENIELDLIGNIE